MQRRTTLNTVLVVGAFALGAATTAGAAALITGKQIKDGTRRALTPLRQPIRRVVP